VFRIGELLPLAYPLKYVGSQYFGIFNVGKWMDKMFVMHYYNSI
jgi:hypothetical protein